MNPMMWFPAETARQRDLHIAYGNPLYTSALSLTARLLRIISINYFDDDVALQANLSCRLHKCKFILFRQFTGT